MPFNVLLLPLLGGYVFITYWDRTRFDAKRYSGERLLFHAALAGVVFLVASYLLVAFVVYMWPTAAVTWHARIPFDHSGTSLGAFLLGVFAWIPLNWFLDESKEVKRCIEEWNDYLETLLYKALHETRHVAITLKNGKVYIGLVVRTFNPAYERKYMLLLPTVSGYRQHPTHDLKLTTDYTAVYEQLIATEEPNLLPTIDNFQLVIPVAEVMSASLFDWDVYDRFNPVSSDVQAQETSV